ncbi:MFS transporter [Acetobacter syzygii]|uniref:MFS transporter n=1 Tax=Acetobacter syzygii TaxID=146476 RepID=UPI0020C6CC56|nr:MFS transporter [Acetobacter syzygii]
MSISLMYCAQGIPAGLAFNAFSTILRHSGTSLAHIGLTGLLFLPWALKFLWSGMADNAGKQWGYGRLALWTHMTAILVCLLLAFMPPAQNFPIVLCGILLLNTIFATQDIFTNACAVSHMQGRYAGLANALQVITFLLGMVVGGAGSLLIYEHTGWGGVMLCMACELFILWLFLLPLRTCVEPCLSNKQRTPSTLIALFNQPGFLWAILIAVTFKFSGSAMAIMLQPWLIDRSFSITFCGTLQMSNIIWSALGGAVIGFPAVRLMGSRRAVLYLAGPSVTLLGCLWFLQTMELENHTILCAILGLENFVDGGFYVSIWALLMNWSSAERPGTDYSFLQCGESLTNVLAGLSIPPLAAIVGYEGIFLIVWGIGAGLLFLLALATRKLRPYT